MGMTRGHFFGVDFSAEPTAGSGLAMIAGIKTLDTSIIGAIIISGLVTAIHNRFFDKSLPVFLGIFGHLVCRYPRVLRDDPCAADAAGLAESADGH